MLAYRTPCFSFQSAVLQLSDVALWNVIDVDRRTSQLSIHLAVIYSNELQLPHFGADPFIYLFVYEQCDSLTKLKIDQTL